MIDLIKDKERILNFIVEKGKTFRKQIAVELNILPRNLNRNIDKLIEENEIKKDKEGKEVFYIPIGNEIEPTLNSSIAEEPQTETSKKKRKTKADVLYDIICSLDHDPSRQELRALTGLSEKNFDQRMKRNLREGKVERYKVGKNAYYHKSGNVKHIEPVQSFTRLNADLTRIPPLQAFIDYLRGENYSEKSITEYKRIITTFYHFKGDSKTGFKVYPVEQLTIRDIDAFRNKLNEKQQSDAAIRHAMVALKAYFKYLKSRKYIIEDFLADYKFPPIQARPQPVATIEEWWQCVKAVKPKMKIRDCALLLLMFDTGLRVSEAETICREHIYFETKEIKVLGAKGKRMKGAKIPRLLPIAQITLDYLRKVIEMTKKEVIITYRLNDGTEESGTAVFLNDQDEQAEQLNIKTRKVRDFILQLRERCKLSQKITVHSFRRLMDLTLTNSGMRIDFVADRMGHVPENKMTIAYINAAPDYKAEYKKQYQQTHPLNEPGFVRKFKTIVEESA